MTVKASDLLQEAKNRLIEDGWIQYHLHRQEGHCLTGALHEAAGRVEVDEYCDWVSANRILTETIEANSRAETIVGWNDHRTRTFDQVMEMLDKAILAAKEAEA